MILAPSLVLKCVLFETTKKGLLNSTEIYGYSFMERPSICVCFLPPLKMGIKKKVYFNLLTFSDLMDYLILLMRSTLNSALDITSSF